MFVGTWTFVATIKYGEHGNNGSATIVESPHTLNVFTPYNPIRCSKTYAIFGPDCYKLTGIRNSIYPFLATKA